MWFDVVWFGVFQCVPVFFGVVLVWFGVVWYGLEWVDRCSWFILVGVMY